MQKINQQINNSVFVFKLINRKFLYFIFCCLKVNHGKVMRKLNVTYLLLTVLIFASCNKKESAQEIRVKKNDADNQHSKIEESKVKDEKKSESEKPSLQTITSKEVKLHIGDSLIIKGYVADIYLSDKVAYLNFENKFPNNVFACAIFSGKFDEFGDLSKYKNKNVELTGKISTYKSKPQVILESKSQIKIIQ